MENLLLVNTVTLSQLSSEINASVAQILKLNMVLQSTVNSANKNALSIGMMIIRR